MALADSQKISRVLSGKPFGDGRDGSLTISSNTTQTLTDESCSGSSGSTSLTTVGTTLSNDDIILIHQSRGTGAGNWEINKVASGGGTTSITLAENLANTYTDSGASQAQAIVIPMYTDITVNSSQTWNGKDWDNNVGGFLIAACNGVHTVNGALNHDGSNGAYTANNTTGGGFYGGGGKGSGSSSGDSGIQGEGDPGAGTTSSNGSNNGSGGGPAYNSANNFGRAAGGGGGNGTAGSNGTTSIDYGRVGSGGDTHGNAEMTNFVFGAGGGGGLTSNGGGEQYGSGGSGAGAIVFFAKEFDISSGSASLDGGDGFNADNQADGGHGAGGSMLVMGETVNMGSSVITASGSSAAGGGGNGGDGRIAVHYSDSVTGTTSPTLNSTEDSTLVELGHYPQIMTF